jgi:hypothetical protein
MSVQASTAFILSVAVAVVGGVMSGCGFPSSSASPIDVADAEPLDSGVSARDATHSHDAEGGVRHDAGVPRGDAPREDASSGLKYHPGHYVELDPGSGCGKLSCYQSVIASLAGKPGIVGAFLIQPWSQLEGNEGDYSAGFALVDALLAAAKAADLQLMIGVQGKVFGTYYPNAGSYGELPPYFDSVVCADGPPGYLSATSNGASGSLLVTPKNYDPCVTMRRIAMVRAYGSRYDADPNFEMWNDDDETANGLYASPGQYDGDVAQDIAWAAAARAAFPHTQLRLTTNFFDTAEQFTNLFTGIEPYGIAVGGPDVSLDLPGSPPFPGTDAIVFNGWEDGKDWRNVLPRIAEVQWGDSAASGGVTQAQLYDEEYTGTTISGGSVNPNYFVWGAAQENPAWTLASTVSFVASIGGKVNTKCPSTTVCN